jgi:hypothetical protein
MKELKGISFQSSKNDRIVLRRFFFIFGMIVSIIGVVFLLFYLRIVYNAKRDSASLDLLLTGQQIDQVEFFSPYGTNVLAAPDVQKFVASLHKTNRTSHIDWTKQQVQGVRLLSGTNEIWLSLGEDGSWEFREYGFRLRSQ